jgi:PAS domain S-box-containing protein
LSYQKKLLIFMVSMVIFVGGTMGLLIRFIIFPYLIREMEGRGVSVARRLAESSRTFILTRDTVSLTALLFDEKRLEGNIAYILVSDPDGLLLAHTLVGVDPADVALHPVVPDAQAVEVAGFVPPGSRDRILDIILPVHEGLYQIGAIRIGLDTQFISSVIRKLSFYQFAFTGFITLIGLGFGLYLSRVITRPIVSLKMLAEQISLGNLNTHISLGPREGCWEIRGCEQDDCPAFRNELLQCWFVDNTPCKESSICRFPEKLEECKGCRVYKMQAGDEIVQLADAFNHMAQRLRASEMELRCSEQRYRLLFNHDPNPVFVVEAASLTILDANERATEKYGYAKDRLTGMRFTDLGFEEDAARIAGALVSIDREQDPCSWLPRIRHRREDGDAFWVNLYFCHHEHQGRAAVIVTTTDITGIIETETNLIQASKMATLGEMAAGVAHELNQPLNAIKLGSEFLQTMTEQQRAIGEADLQEVARQVSTEVDRASGIIGHLREFGRKSSVARHAMDINKPILGVFTILGQQLKVHGIDVVTELDADLPLVLADENRLEQVLINLVINARDAMEARKEQGLPAAPSILTVRSFLDGDHVMVTVSDTGVGMPRAVQGRIFEPFFTTKAVGKGTGLGLSISYGIVRDYGGTIDLETTEGAGTTFKLSFPRAPDEEAND